MSESTSEITSEITVVDAPERRRFEILGSPNTTTAARFGSSRTP